MGLFDDYDIDMDEVEAAGGFDFKDGIYEFEVAEALLQQGSKNKPDVTFFIIKYDLDEAGVYWEWFTVAVDRDAEHPDAKRGLGYLKGRLQDLGFQAAELNDIEPEDVEGITGTLKLVTTQGKGKNAGNSYQNVRDVKVGEVADEPEDEPEEAPAPRRRTAKPAAEPEEDDAAIKRRVAAKRAEREAAPAKRTVTKPATRRRGAAASEDEDEENPFG